MTALSAEGGGHEATGRLPVRDNQSNAFRLHNALVVNNSGDD